MSKRRNIRKKEKSRNKKSTNLLLLSGVVIAAMLIVAYWFRMPDSIEPGSGVLATPIPVHDFGPVPVSRGTVSTELPLANIGDEDLVISFLDTSCGCTTARVINGGETGPVFGMSSHGKSPRDWQTVIEPGEQAKLKISYDPSVHPNFRGPGTRVVTITTNGKSTPEKQIRIKVMQIN
jgi:hypothetical protein